MILVERERERKKERERESELRCSELTRTKRKERNGFQRMNEESCI